MRKRIDEIALILAICLVFWAVLGTLLHGPGYEAEAVIGGMGNVTDTNNPHNFSYGSSEQLKTREDYAEIIKQQQAKIAEVVDTIDRIEDKSWLYRYKV